MTFVPVDDNLSKYVGENDMVLSKEERARKRASAHTCRLLPPSKNALCCRRGVLYGVVELVVPSRAVDVALARRARARCPAPSVYLYQLLTLVNNFSPSRTGNTYSGRRTVIRYRGTGSRL